jgi:hypothetical protein
VTTSARTRLAAVDALSAAIDVPCLLYRWATHGADNPYFGFLALADEIIVTGDSISMLTEASATGKPVFIFPFGTSSLEMGPDWRTASLHRGPGKGPLGRPFRPHVWLYSLWMRMPPGRWNRSRDIRLVHDAFIESGRARWLGDPGQGRAPVRPLEDMERTVARVRGLFAESRPVAAQAGD